MRLSLPLPFIGLFFHKFGHMSAVVGLTEEPLRAVWYKYESDLPYTGMGPKDVSENRLGSGPAAAAAAADAVNLTTAKGGVNYIESEVDDEDVSKGEGDAKRGRALGVLQGRELEEDWKTRLSPGEEGSEEARSEAWRWGSGGASEERSARDAGRGLRGRKRERYVPRQVLEEEPGSQR